MNHRRHTTRLRTSSDLSSHAMEPSNTPNNLSSHTTRPSNHPSYLSIHTTRPSIHPTRPNQTIQPHNQTIQPHNQTIQPHNPIYPFTQPHLSIHATRPSINAKKPSIHARRPSNTPIDLSIHTTRPSIHTMEPSNTPINLSSHAMNHPRQWRGHKSTRVFIIGHSSRKMWGKNREVSNILRRAVGGVCECSLFHSPTPTIQHTNQSIQTCEQVSKLIWHPTIQPHTDLSSHTTRPSSHTMKPTQHTKCYPVTQGDHP